MSDLSITKTSGITGAEKPQPAEKKISESIRDIRNIALGISAVSGTALVAEAAGIVTLPAVMPTGALLAGSLVSAGALELLSRVAEAAEQAVANTKLIFE